MTALITLGIAIGILLAVIAIRRSHIITAATAALGLAAALAALPYATLVPPNLFTFDAAAIGFIALILAAGFLVLIIAYAYFQTGIPVPREEFYLLLLLATLGACALAASASFITLFLGLETMTLAMIGMIAYPRFRPAAEEAGLKYLVLSGMSSAFILFGIGLIELATNNLSLSQPFTASPTELTGLAMIGAGAGFKLSVVPFHIWVPDIFGGAAAPAAAFIAVIAKIAVLAVLVRMLHGAPLPQNAATAITIIAMLSMLAGNLLALLQQNTKRIFGYSSIAHLGYLLVAILAAGALGRAAVAFYIVTYAITMIAAFGVIAALSHAAAPRDADTLADLRGLAWTRPALAAVLILALLSLAGIPPAIGFIAKMYIFAAGIRTDLFLLIATMIVSSVIGLFVYLNMIIVMLQKPETAPAGRIPAASRLAMALVGLPMIGFGIAPQPLIAFLKTVFG